MKRSLFQIIFFLFFFFIITINCNEDTSTLKLQQEENKEENNKEKIKIKRKKKSTKDWDKLSENELEKDWEKGDESIELEHEFERIQKIQAKKSKKMSNILDSNDPAQIAKL